MLQLALKTGWTLEYIESLPFETIAEFKALNIWVPWSDERQSQQLGLIASLLSHQVYKKGQSPAELFPYLKGGVPEFLEDDRVTKARKLLQSTINMPEHLRDANRQAYIDAIREEIEIEQGLDSPDHYVIRQLQKLTD